MKKNNILFGVALCITMILIFVMLGLIYVEIRNGRSTYIEESEDGTFSSAFIQESHDYLKDKNYMVSPYSVEIALSMLREGAKGKTLEELNAVVPERSIKTLTVKNRVNVANAIFIKDRYKDDMLPSYMEVLDQKYNADVIVDPFKSPAKINNWVKQETNGMIPKILESMAPDFVLGVANAVAMEEKWKEEFECERTVEYSFTKADGKEFKTSMMFHSYQEDASYYESDQMQAVILPYTTYNRNTGKKAKQGEQLDFIGIIPNDIDDYVSNFTLDDMKEIVDNSQLATEDYEVSVGLPRFEFSFDYGDDFKSALMGMGIKKLFSRSCDLSGIIQNENGIHVSDAIHKTYVKVDESGTKAAAVTYFGTKENTVRESGASIVFEKPFVFIIKDHASNEILFFGTVYEPEKWSGKNTCD